MVMLKEGQHPNWGHHTNMLRSHARVELGAFTMSQLRSLWYLRHCISVVAKRADAQANVQANAQTKARANATKTLNGSVAEVVQSSPLAELDGESMQTQREFMIDQIMLLEIQQVGAPQVQNPQIALDISCNFTMQGVTLELGDLQVDHG